jgi:RNA polymerase sigma-70 factor (sigma-E family)
VIAAVERPETGADELERLFRAHATALLRLALVLTGDRALAEDLVQEAFVRRHWAGLAAADHELAYLRSTVINLSHSHHRHLRVVRRTPTTPPLDAAPADAELGGREDQRRIVAAVRALPTRQRDCVVLRYYADLTDTEIADALGISAGSVKTHLHRARATLADRLEDLR